MEGILAKRAEIGRIASTVAPGRRSWAVVGSGPDHVAAAEVRIKLSELCYKAIALDGVEDKKHIDLSAEPMVIVCAPSARGPNARDIAKEVEIFRAHKAAPVVIVTEAEKGTINPEVEVITVPACHPDLAFVLAAMAGHIFGYEAALAIDAQARPLREARAVVESATRGGGAPVLERLAPALELAAAPAMAGLRAGAYDGHLNASTASRLTSLLRYATGALPVESYEAEMGKVGAPRAIADDLVVALGNAIDELTRPIDAIKHQAKTVTVGIFKERRRPFESPAGVRDAGRRAQRRLPRLPRPTHPGRAGTGGRGGARLHALPGANDRPDNRGPEPRRGRRSMSSTAAASPPGYRPARRPTTPCGVPSTAPPKRGR